MTQIEELEKVLLDQIEKLNDDSIGDDVEQGKMMVERSQAISKLADSYISINRMKLDVVKTLSDNGGLYENYLGIENKGGK